MTAYAALLRAINVGGTGKLPMSELRQLCEDAGLSDVATYIQSGNVVFRSQRAEAGVKKLLERALAEKLGKPVGVFVRTRAELAAVLEANPFVKAAPNQVLVLFLDVAPPQGSMEELKPPGGEQVSAQGREVFIHFPQGMGKSKLKLPFQATVTSRNLNTVQKLVSLLEKLEGD
jgi:uncharacterized protein (DUF1697 family)